MEGQKHPQVVVVMVPLPAQGHLNQLLHLAHLVTSYGIPVHYAGSAIHTRQAKLRLHGRNTESLTKIHFHDFELPPYTAPPPNPDPSMQFPAHLQPLFDTCIHLRQPVFKLLRQLSTECRRIIVIHDSLMVSVVQDVKFIPNAEAYAFNSVSAFIRFLGLWESIPEKPFQLDSDVIPGCTPSMEGSLTPEVIKFIIDQRKFRELESGWLHNTSRVIEGRYVELLEKLSENLADSKQFAIGPFNPVTMETSTGKSRHRCLEWLDEQDKGSVIYVSFGSTTTLTDEQIRELAIGLERSEQKFVWVLRNADKGNIFANGEVRKLELPEGYEERLIHRGMVIRDWAPQLDILAHQATGGFMSHCGWNSCMESVSMGVPIVAWPMHSDQPRNAVLLKEVLRIGTVVREWAQRTEIVTRTTIENAVKKMMASKEGEDMRKRAAELGNAVRQSVSKSGASLEMDAFIAHITR